jgi:hypothetical protein
MALVNWPVLVRLARAERMAYALVMGTVSAAKFGALMWSCKNRSILGWFLVQTLFRLARFLFRSSGVTVL